ncbi:hypothetical protein F5877DRAFT_69902 [Lentinula edodes]|nr:hypothetical protein F5877DRAFT_69902 [Lentinula edodes]
MSSSPNPARQQQRQRQSSVHSRSRSRSTSSGPRQRGERKRPNRGNGLPGIDEADKGAIQRPGGNDGQPRRQPPRQQPQPPPKKTGEDEDGGGSGDKPLRLRLDLNLDVAVEIKARVHGDLTLSLLFDLGLRFILSSCDDMYNVEKLLRVQNVRLEDRIKFMTSKWASPSSNGPRQRGDRKRPNRGNELPGIDEADDSKRALQHSGVGNDGQSRKQAPPLQQQQPLQPPQKGGDDEDRGGGGDKPLKLQLDLNLDVAVEIKARAMIEDDHLVSISESQISLLEK